jgi:hypothetical protein
MTLYDCSVSVEGNYRLFRISRAHISGRSSVCSKALNYLRPVPAPGASLSESGSTFQSKIEWRTPDNASMHGCTGCDKTSSEWHTLYFLFITAQVGTVLLAGFVKDGPAT